MQAQVEATEKLLSSEQASNASLRSQSSALSSELNKVKSELAGTVQQLEAERSVSNELKEQLEAIKSEYITAGVWERGGTQVRDLPQLRPGHQNAQASLTPVALMSLVCWCTWLNCVLAKWCSYPCH